MGTSLDNSTTTPVPQKVKEAIESDALRLEPAHGWWAEPLNFFASRDADGRLYGGTKVSLVSYLTDGGYVEMDADDDSSMAYRDTCFILDKLAEWSQKQGLTWQVECTGEPIGTIRNGKRDRQLQEYIDAIKDSFPWPLVFDKSESTICEVFVSKVVGLCPIRGCDIRYTHANTELLSTN